ncbi:MAG: helix-turn-helix domain-containing protein [Phycisphaerales bacterium]|nr:helix-turn-helix domain-containing protein [Phycisphaerales bacterium]
MDEENSILIKLGDNLRSAREGKKLSQEALASKAGLHRTYIGSVERGEYNVTILSLRKITNALGISLQQAVRGIS